MAGSTRLELATSYVTGRRSNRLSYDPIKLVIYTIFTFPSQPFFIKKLEQNPEIRENDKSLIFYTRGHGMKRILIIITVSLTVGLLLGGFTVYKAKSGSDNKRAMASFAEGKKNFDAQRYPEAAEMFNRSIGLKPDMDSAHVMLSSAYQKMGLVELANKELEAGGVKNGK